MPFAQDSKSRSNIAGWLRSVGGIGKPWGLIHELSDGRTRAYEPGNDLLIVLVQLCAIDFEKWHPQKNARPKSFTVTHFLEWVEERFGIIVDRPPDDHGFDSPEYFQAARENVQEMLRRLRQMGIFEDRSDDLSVQRLTPPFLSDPVRSAS